MTRPDKVSTETIIEVPFHDVDSLGIVWHGHYAKYIELARCDLLDSINYNYIDMRESGYMWPVIDMRLRYAQAARFRQKLRVIATLAEWENRLKINYEIRDVEADYRITKGYTVQVAVDAKTKEMLLESPPILKERLGL